MLETTCRVCGAPTDALFHKRVLARHDVGYHRCRSCGFVQTDPPHWLEEAYDDAISAIDTGLLGRALSLAPRVESVIRRAHPPDGRFLDYGGGSGVFVRHMRDRGFRFYRYDPHARPVFSRYFDLGDLSPAERHFELVTAFEVLEHLPDPVGEVATMLGFADDVLFTTELVPAGGAPEISGWWYLGPEHGQHVSFYTPQSLSELARRLGAQYLQLAPDLHLVSRDRRAAERLAQEPDPRPLDSLTWNDSLLAASRRAAEKAGGTAAWKGLFRWMRPRRKE